MSEIVIGGLDLRSYIHDLFLKSEYSEWRSSLDQYKPNTWHSLIALLHDSGSQVDTLLGFGEDVCSKLVFSCMQAPDFRDSGSYMIQFTVTGSTWHSIIWYRPSSGANDL